MDYNCNAVYGVCAILTFLGLFIFLFTYFLCQFKSIGYTSQPDNLNNTQVLIHHCEEGSGKCYIVDQNVIKISCPILIGQKVNKIFHFMLRSFIEYLDFDYHIYFFIIMFQELIRSIIYLSYIDHLYNLHLLICALHALLLHN